MVRSSQPVAKAGVAARDGEEGDAHQDQGQIEHGAPQNVATALSLSAYRDGVRTYHFQGTNLPRRAGQLITLYRYATASGGYCVPAPESYTGSGSSTFPSYGHRRYTSFTHSRNSSKSVLARDRKRKNCELPWSRG